MPLVPIDPVRAHMRLNATRPALPGIQQKPASSSIAKWCSDLFQRGRCSRPPAQLTQFRSYRQPSMAFSAQLSDGKVMTEGSHAGQDIAHQLNRLPKRFMQDPDYTGKGQGLRILDETLNVFHIQSTPAAAAVLKSSRTLAAQPLPLANPGRAHLGQISGVHTTDDGRQFRLVEQRLHRFEPQTLSWLPDKDEAAYSRLGLTREGALMKVPLGVGDMSVEGKTQVSLEPWAEGFSLRISRDATAPGTHLVPVSESGKPVQLTRIGLSGDTLYASNAQGELLRGDLRSAQAGRLRMVPEPAGKLESLYKGGVSIKGFMHDDAGQLNALIRDTHNQLHSAPLTDTPSQEPGWNLSDVLFKVIDKGLPEPGLRALANAVDLGQRGKVALEGNTLLCWDSQAQQWEKTDHMNVDQLERGLDGRAYVLQAGQLQELATHKSRGSVYMEASYDLAPPEGARTHVTLSSGASVKGERQITGFAVENAKRFVTLDQDNQLHAHVDGAERVLSFTLPKALKALALDRRGDLYAQSRTGELLKLEKAHWQSPSSTAKTWEAVKLPGNECLKSLRMGPDKQLIASWGENDPQQNRWGEIFRQLVVSPDGQPKWEAPAPPKAGDSSLNSVLSGGEIKSQNNGTAWAVTSTVLGHKAEGLERDRGLLSGIGAHIKPLEGLKNIGLDIQHHFKGRAGLAGLYADDRALRGQLDALAKAAPCTTNMTTRLERLSEQQSTQALAGALKHALGQVEKNSESLAIRLGDIKGARVIPEQAVAAVDHSAKRSAFSLNQMRQTFENLAPSNTNTTAALLRSYEKQGVSLSPWHGDQKRDLGNPTALIESDLIQHARTLSRLGELITLLENDPPDQPLISGTLEVIMQAYHDSPVHKKASQQINSFAQAETLYKNFKLLAKDLSNPGSALHFHIARTLGIGGKGDIKQVLMQHIQQSDSGQSIASSRTKTKAAGVFATGMLPVPLLEVFVGVSRAKASGVIFSRTDTGATIEINSGTAHGLSASLGSGVTLMPVGDAFGTGVRVGAEATLAVSRDTGASVSFDVTEADLPAAMEILAGRKGDVFDLLDLGCNHQSGQRSKNTVDLSVSALVQGRAHVLLPENSDALAGLVRAVINVGGGLNLAHFDQSRSVSQGAKDMTWAGGDNFQLLAKGSASAGVGPANTAALAQVDSGGSTLVGFTGSDISLTVSFDRSAARAMRFTFKQPVAIEQAKINDLRDALSSHSPQLKEQLLARVPAEGLPIEQLQSLQRLLEQQSVPDTRPQEHHGLKNQLQQLLHQQALIAQGKRELSSVEGTVTYVGLSGGAQDEWLNDVAPANKAAILHLLASQPQLARTLEDLKSNQGTSVSIGLEVKPDVLRMIESKVGDGRSPEYDVQQALKNPDNLRIKTMSVSYTASRTHSMALPTPVLSFSSSAALSHTHKVLNTEFEYGRDQNVPVSMKLKDVVSEPGKTEFNPEVLDLKIRDGRRPLM